jgi:acid phosphatase class B
MKTELLEIFKRILDENDAFYSKKNNFWEKINKITSKNEIPKPVNPKITC